MGADYLSAIDNELIGPEVSRSARLPTFYYARESAMAGGHFHALSTDSAAIMAIHFDPRMGVSMPKGLPPEPFAYRFVGGINGFSIISRRLLSMRCWRSLSIRTTQSLKASDFGWSPRDTHRSLSRCASCPADVQLATSAPSINRRAGRQKK